MSLRGVSRWLTPVMMLLAVSCGNDENVAVAPEAEPADPPFAVVVSDVIGPPGSDAAGGGMARVAVAGPVAYVSLLPGAIPHGAKVLVQNTKSGAETTAPIIDGGADPVQIPAQEGDALRIVATDSTGADVTYVTMVKGRVPPRVVRTQPTPGRTDVPLNAIIQVVFSEPVDPSTVESRVHLRGASGPVAGVVHLVDGSSGVIAFVPGGPLAAATNYTIDIDVGVLDLEGDSLLAAVTVPFVTSGSPPPTTPPSLPPTGVGVARLRVINAVPGVGAMDVRISGTEAVSNLPYLGATGYLEVTAGSHSVAYQVSSGTMDGYEGSFAAGAEYTAIPCCKWMPNGNLLVDDNSEPLAGQARIRFVDYASLSESVKIYLTSPGADLATAVPIPVDVTWATDYFTVPAGEYEIRITAFDSDVVAIDSGSLTLLAGQVRTVIAVDAPGGGEPHGFLILEDRH